MSPVSPSDARQPAPSPERCSPMSPERCSLVGACANHAPADMAGLDEAVIATVARTVNPKVIDRALSLAEAATLSDATSGDRETITKELADIERACARLRRAIASSDDLAP